MKTGFSPRQYTTFGLLLVSMGSANLHAQSFILSDELRTAAHNNTWQNDLRISDVTPSWVHRSGDSFQVQDPDIASGNDAIVMIFAAAIDGRLQAYTTWKTGTDLYFEDFIPLEVGNFTETYEPTADFGNDGLPAFLWIASDDAGHHLRFQIPGNDTETIARSPLPMESTSLIHHNGNPIVTWTEGEAGVFQVYLAEKSDADWNIVSLSPDLNSYDILPRVLETTPPSVFWYSLRQDGFSVQARQQTGTGWTDFPSGIAALPSDRLPWLFALDNVAEPGAIWIEPGTTNDQLFYYDPRLIDDFSITSLPTRSGYDQLDPDASATSSMAFVWVEQSRESTELRVIAKDRKYTFNTIPAPTQPRIHWLDDNNLIICVVSDRAQGGTGSLYSVQIELQ